MKHVLIAGLLLALLLAARFAPAQVAAAQAAASRVAAAPPALTPADKVYGLSKFWQEVNYNFVYWGRVNQARWDSTYRALIPVVQQTPDDYQYYRELQKFCATLRDGHTTVTMPPQVRTMTSMFGPYRLFVENVENRAIITHVNPGKKAELPVGSEIVEVNGQPTALYLAAHVTPYVASSTDYVRQDQACRDLLKGLPGETFRLKVKRPSGDVVALTLTHQPTTETEVFPALDFNRPLLELRWYDHQQVAYVALNSFSDPKIDSLFEQAVPALSRARALVIDLRRNGGGDTGIGLDILRYLVQDSVVYGARSKTRLHLPAYKAWGAHLTAADTVAGRPERGLSKTEAVERYRAARGTRYYALPYGPDTLRLPRTRLLVPTVVLLGHATASAAEDFLIYADHQPRIRTMGQRSFGSTGQPLYFELPGGGAARVCTKNDAYPDGREFVGVGIRPDEEVPVTLRDYLRGEDLALTRARAYLRRQLR